MKSKTIGITDPSTGNKSRFVLGTLDIRTTNDIGIPISKIIAAIVKYISSTITT
jgi:hypothetical protein